MVVLGLLVYRAKNLDPIIGRGVVWLGTGIPGHGDIEWVKSVSLSVIPPR